jgi:hypothetical protein
MPEGWFGGRLGPIATIPANQACLPNLNGPAHCLETLFAGDLESFIRWVSTHNSARCHPFELSVREADLETVVKTFRASTRASKASLYKSEP